jgi:uncharacterized protein YuzE
MTHATDSTGIELSINARNDGTLEAAYVQITSEPVTSSLELIKSVLVVDFDDRGEIVGVEILAPVKIADVEKIAEKSLKSPQSDSLLRFLRKYASGLLTP